MKFFPFAGCPWRCWLAACHKAAPPPVYQAVAVQRRDITVTAQASGAINPDTTVQVKSKASGEILDIKVSDGRRRSSAAR